MTEAPLLSLEMHGMQDILFTRQRLIMRCPSFAHLEGTHALSILRHRLWYTEGTRSRCLTRETCKNNGKVQVLKRCLSFAHVKKNSRIALSSPARPAARFRVHHTANRLGTKKACVSTRNSCAWLRMQMLLRNMVVGKRA